MSICCAPPLQAQADTTRSTISGRVVDPAQQPLEGVEVRLVGDSLRHFTSAAGTFRLYAPGGVEVLLQFRRPGYNAQLLKHRGDWNGTVQMVPGAFVLPEVLVNAHYAKPAEYAFTAKYDDYFRRRRQGLGQFITRDQLDRRLAMQTIEILEGQPGVRVSIKPGYGASVVFARCNEYPPKINVYVDGHKLLPNLRKLIDVGGPSILMEGPKPKDPEVSTMVGEMFSRVNPREIELIEIFRGPGELPAEFNDGNCGAIVIWTRVGPR